MSKITNSIGIFGVPRSGTSWLGQIFNSHSDVEFKFQPLFSYAFKDYLDENSPLEKIEDFFLKIKESDDYFLNMKDPVIHKNYPDFSKHPHPRLLVYKEVRYHHVIQNILEKTDDSKFIFIVRNPFPVLSSWAKAPKEFDKSWDFMEEWEFARKKNLGRKEEFYGYDGWKKATLIFHKLKERFPDRVEIVKYSDLLKNPEKITRELFSFAGLDWDLQTEKFIDESMSRKDNDPNSVYKAKQNDDDWNTFIPEEVKLKITNDLSNTPLSEYLK